jgi:hypothetical protein
MAGQGEPLYNLTWAMNGYKGIHSEAYARAVYERLLAAEAEGGPEAVKDALAEMGKILSQGGTFW